MPNLCTPTHVLAFLPPQALDLPACAPESVFCPPVSIVWMPVGETVISAGGGVDGEGFAGAVLCDEQAFNSIAASFAQITAAGSRVWIDFNHDDAEAAGWVKGFSYAPDKGIVAHVEWTPCGAKALGDKTYYSFSPAFLIDRETKRPVSLIPGHAAGGLVNAPAFGARMPALIAARLSGPAPTSAATSAAENQTTQNNNMPATTSAAPAASTTAAPVQAADAPDLAKVVEMLTTLSATVAAMKGEGDEEEKVTASTPAPAAPVAVAASAPVAPAVVEAKRSEPATVLELSLLDSVRAYANKRNSPAEASKVFARHIAPGYKKNWTGPELAQVLAANSLGSLAGDLIAQQSLTLLKLELPILTRITTDFSNLNAQYNQTIKTRTRTVPGVSVFSPANGYVKQDAGTTDVDVVIDNNVGVPIEFSVNELASTSRDLFGEQAEGAAYALGKYMVDAIYAEILAASFTNATTKALGSFARADVTAMAKALYDRGVAGRDRILLLNSSYFEKLMSDSTIVNLAAYQRASLIEEYSLPPVAGFNVMQAVNLPSNSENLTGFGFAPDALVIATRVPNDYTQALPNSSYGSVSTVTNADTGISVQLAQYVNHDLARATWRMAVMFGTAVGQGASGQRLISA